jgi:hypothetical protein
MSLDCFFEAGLVLVGSVQLLLTLEELGSQVLNFLMQRLEFRLEAGDLLGVTVPHGFVLLLQGFR